jgi:hypothetical protein
MAAEVLTSRRQLISELQRLALDLLTFGGPALVPHLFVAANQEHAFHGHSPILRLADVENPGAIRPETQPIGLGAEPPRRRAQRLVALPEPMSAPTDLLTTDWNDLVPSKYEADSCSSAATWPWRFRDSITTIRRPWRSPRSTSAPDACG